jgi:hypothetical protein
MVMVDMVGDESETVKNCVLLVVGFVVLDGQHASLFFSFVCQKRPRDLAR